MVPREIIRRARRIEMVTRRLVNRQLAGQYHSVFKGRGMDFDEVHPYAEGDDVRFIDWNVSAKTGEIHIKRFVEERELTVQLVVDASASMRFGSAVEDKRTIAAYVAAVLAMLAITNNDRVGLTVFDEKVDLYVPPKRGKKHVMRLITEILTHDAAQQARTSLAEALSYVTRVTRRRAIVFVISDFADAGWEHQLKVAAQRHDVVPVRIGDPLERSLAPLMPVADATPGEEGWLKRIIRFFAEGGLVELRDLESGEDVTVDVTSAAQSRALQAAAGTERAALEQTFRSLKLDSIELNTDIEGDIAFVRPLATFFKLRARRH